MTNSTIYNSIKLKKLHAQKNLKKKEEKKKNLCCDVMSEQKYMSEKWCGELKNKAREK